MMGPGVRVRDEAFADGILADVVPFFVVALESAKTGVPFVRLPFPRWVWRFGSESAFPKGDPAVERSFKFVRRAKAMKMIGHQQVVANQPSVGVDP